MELKVYKFQMNDEVVELQILDAAGKRFFREVLDGQFFFFPLLLFTLLLLNKVFIVFTL